MRVCRFQIDDAILSGFYGDDRVVPFVAAADAYAEETGIELDLTAAEELLDLLPPDGSSFKAARDLAAWVDRLDPDGLDELAIPLDEVRLLVPIARPPKLLLLAGNYAAHV